jgi:hypothetical protein
MAQRSSSQVLQRTIVSRFNLMFFLLGHIPCLNNARALIIEEQLKGVEAMNGKILGLVAGLVVGSLLAKTAAAQVVTIDPNNYGNGQVITAPGVTLQTETIVQNGASIEAVFSPVYSFNAVGAGCVPVQCPPVGTNVFSPSPTGASTPGTPNYGVGGSWGGEAFDVCTQNCMYYPLDVGTTYLRVNFATPVDFVEALAFYSGGDPTGIEAFDSAGDELGGTFNSQLSSIGWGYATASTPTADISTVLVGGVNSFRQINQIAYAPEIDPSSAASGLTLLLGGLFVLRGRRTERAYSSLASLKK